MDKLTFPLQGKISISADALKKVFYEQIEQDSRFDKGIHHQYMGLKWIPSWYNGPADSRELARSLVNSAIERVWSVDLSDEHLFPITGASKWTIASGCLQVEIFVIGDTTLGLQVSFTTHDTPTYTVKLNP